MEVVVTVMDYNFWSKDQKIKGIKNILPQKLYIS